MITKEKISVIGIFAAAMLCLSACNNQNQEKMNADKNELTQIFPKGEKGSKDLFTGNAYNTGLVDADSVFTTAVGNVYFEPGARSNWHSHPAGQILIITDGVGYHQIEGRPVEIIKKGYVIKCPPNVRHWHGASADVGLQQLYIVPNTEKGIVNWNEAVIDKVYKSAE
ncbi:cupin domain-containing protein [Flavobacterium sp. CFBP9031]|uniref:cupin domain-containing protein n=1 Tax=Flavobacterium sp. CFBP9031 TaxID=3096538 RepID=UPI002A6A019F|nr:cupin domain-containing protein [Flavobacterium sp. CFBP9031]MDY0989386.1 cupin domain-containing protein [Flavobacterium sp. CFBP9031]